MALSKPHFSELHQMCVGSVGVKLQHLSVSIRPMFHCHFSWSCRKFLFTQRNKGTIEPQSVLLADVVVVLHGPAFGLPTQRGLRDDQQAARKLQHRHHLPWVGLTQTHVQQCGYWRREGAQYLVISYWRIHRMEIESESESDLLPRRISYTRTLLWYLGA